MTGPPSLMDGQMPGPQKDISFKPCLADLCLPTSFPAPSLVVCLSLLGGEALPLPIKSQKATSQSFEACTALFSSV